MKVYKKITGHAKKSFRKFINNLFKKNFNTNFMKNKKNYYINFFFIKFFLNKLLICILRIFVSIF